MESFRDGLDVGLISCPSADAEVSLMLFLRD